MDVNSWLSPVDGQNNRMPYDVSLITLITICLSTTPWPSGSEH